MKRGLFRFGVALALAAFGLAAKADLIRLNQRDYTGNHTATDRFWFHKDSNGSEISGGGVYPSIEWVYGRGENYPVVYTKSGTATIGLTFLNPQPFSPVSATFSVSNVRFHIPSAIAGIDVYVTLSASVTNGSMYMEPEDGTDTCTVTLTGLPDYVAYGYIEITATVVGGTTTYWNSGSHAQWEEVFLTDSTPQDMQQVPWTDLLSYSCRWAYICHDSSASVSQEVTEGLYWEGRWVYNPDGNWFWKDASRTDTTTVTYHLKDALNGAGPLYMDCRDVSGFVMLCVEGLGYSAAVRTSWNGTYYPDGIETNPLCPMGDNALQEGNYYPYDFYFHQYANVGGTVYDAAAAQLVDPDGESYLWVPEGWGLSAFWQTSDGSGGFYGLVFGVGGASSPSQVTNGGINRGINHIT